jgi:hypothetical protein
VCCTCSFTGILKSNFEPSHHYFIQRQLNFILPWDLHFQIISKFVLRCFELREITVLMSHKWHMWKTHANWESGLSESITLSHLFITKVFNWVSIHSCLCLQDTCVSVWYCNSIKNKNCWGSHRVYCHKSLLDPQQDNPIHWPMFQQFFTLATAKMLYIAVHFVAVSELETHKCDRAMLTIIRPAGQQTSFWYELVSILFFDMRDSQILSFPVYNCTGIAAQQFFFISWSFYIWESKSSWCSRKVIWFCL